MMKIIKLAIILILFNATAYADQTFFVKNNATINAVLSQREITRISFENEIVSINSIKGELEYDIQGKDIFVRSNSDKPVNFFVKTEAENFYKIIAEIENIPATQILIRSNKISTISYKNHLSEDLKIRIAKIIDVTLKPRKHLGYVNKKLNKSIESPIQNLSMHIVGEVSGNMLKAEKILVKNNGSILQNLNLEDFVTENLAVYLSKTLLMPGEEAVLIKISEN